MKAKTATESKQHIALSDSLSESVTTIEMRARLPDGKIKMILLGRYKDIPKENSVGALIRWRENNPEMADRIVMTRVDRTYCY